MTSDAAAVARETEAWVREFVVALGLCPFAEAPLSAGLVSIRVSEARSPEALARDLERALSEVATTPATDLETLLLVHPQVLLDFDEYNAFLDVVDRLVVDGAHEGVLQVASFHPGYRFAEAPADDPANYSNRSPHPMLHILREETVTRAIRTHGEPEAIPARNVRLLREMGEAGIRERLGASGGA